MQTSFRFVTQNESVIHVAYGVDSPNAVLQIPVGHDLLWRDDTEPLEDSCFGAVGNFWGIVHPEGIDFLASAFWFLTNYEAYHKQDRDKYGRFPAKASILFSKDVLYCPWVEKYTLHMRERLQQAGVEDLPKPEFSLQTTFDIDQAYAHKNKTVLRLVLGTAKQLLTFRFADFAQRIAVLMGREQDPFDTFGWIEEIAEKEGLNPLFFLPCGLPGPNDKHNNVELKPIQDLYKRLDKAGLVGLHPSFSSAKSPEVLIREKKKLEEILGRNVTRCRHHYLRISIPQTYRNLVQAGFTDDYSMAYPDAPGYRTGMSKPYFWFDCEQNKKLPIRVHPFAIMEHTFERYMPMDFEAATTEINRIIEATRNVGGLLVVNMHNHKLKEGEQARNLFRYILQKV